MAPRILVIGAGAIGCLVGGKLALSGQPVTLVGRPAFVTAVRAAGLRLDDEAGNHAIRQVTAAGSIAEALGDGSEPFQAAIFTVKSYDTQAALEELAEAQHQRPAAIPTLLSVQNGVGNEEAIAAAFPQATVVAGSIATPVSVLGAGAIRVDKPRYSLGLSPWQPPQENLAFDSLLSTMGRAGFAVTFFPDARGMKWTKLLMNMMGNAASAILDEPPEVVFADSAMVDLELAAWREALAVMAAAGIPAVNLDRYPFATLAPLIRHAPAGVIRPVLRKQIGGARGGKMPSLQLDLQSGKAKSEVLWLNGAVVKAGKEVGVPTPVNATYVAVMRTLLEQPGQRAAWRHNHRKLLGTAQAARDSVLR